MSAARQIYDAAGWWNEHWGRLKVLALWLGVAGAITLIVGGALVHRFGVLGAVAIAIGALFLLVSVIALSIGRIAAKHRPSPPTQPTGTLVEKETTSAPVEASPPVTLSLEEAGELAEQFSKTSKAIYAFLNEQVGVDEQKVVAEYRQKFDAKVLNICLELITAGLSTTERLKNALKPPASVDDIQWVARMLAISGEGYSAERLTKNLERAYKNLGQPLPAPRVLSDLTSGAIFALFEGKTESQRIEVSQAYRGTFIQVSGDVFHIAKHSAKDLDALSVSFVEPNITMFFSSDYAKEIWALRRGDHITVNGVILLADPSWLTLHDCELMPLEGSSV
jgi:hypothetical protein